MKAKIKLMKKQKEMAIHRANKRAKRNIIYIGIAISSLILGYYGLIIKKDHLQRNTYKKYIGKEIPDSMICMVSDIVRSRAADIVEVEGKTYRGCCQKCKNKIKYNHNTRYAIDPFSENTISKANAFIYLNTEESNEVQYFESKENYKNYSLRKSETN